MMNVAIQLDCEQVSRLIYDDLLQTREQFLEDLEKACPSVFSMNDVYDKALIVKHIEALDLLLEWYRDPMSA
jgi:hypothetical protein